MAKPKLSFWTEGLVLCGERMTWEEVKELADSMNTMIDDHESRTEP